LIFDGINRICNLLIRRSHGARECHACHASLSDIARLSCANAVQDAVRSLFNYVDVIPLNYYDDEEEH
jgi:hypothetical protein